MAGGDPGGPAQTPNIVGRYEILREIGRGGMAIVYVARQPDLDRQVALKELSRFHAGSAEYAHRFLRESRMAGSLNHPNIVTVYEYFEHATMPYIAMEYVPRGSLRPYMKRLTLAQIAGVLEGVLAGLAHAEAGGIVHRDLKPENIMVTGDGRVKITDFGIARATQRAGTQYMTATGMTVGTPTYMAPEQAMAGDIGPWSDLYSVGVLTYELLVGHVPFHDTDAPMVILMRHVNERIPSAVEVRPDVDPRLSEWIDALLVKDPQHRVRHAVDAWEALEDITVGLLGPLWRRDARLLDDQIAVSNAVPLTPAPFESQASIRTPTPASSPAVADEFVTFDPSPAVDTPPPAQPPAADTPPPPVQTPPPAQPPAADTPPPAVVSPAAGGRHPTARGRTGARARRDPRPRVRDRGGVRGCRAARDDGGTRATGRRAGGRCRARAGTRCRGAHADSGRARADSRRARADSRRARARAASCGACARGPGLRHLRTRGHRPGAPTPATARAGSCRAGARART